MVQVAARRCAAPVQPIVYGVCPMGEHDWQPTGNGNQERCSKCGAIQDGN